MKRSRCARLRPVLPSQERRVLLRFIIAASHVKQLSANCTSPSGLIKECVEFGGGCCAKVKEFVSQHEGGMFSKIKRIYVYMFCHVQEDLKHMHFTLKVAFLDILLEAFLSSSIHSFVDVLTLRKSSCVFLLRTNTHI